jgi:hypothetical protein
MAKEIERHPPDLTPEINLLKGLAGPRGAAVVQYVQDRYRSRQRKFLDGVQEDSGKKPEELGHQIITNERLGDLLLAGAEASARTCDQAHIHLLARVVAEAFTDEAKLDACEVRLQTLRQMTSQEIRALAVLAKRDEERAKWAPSGVWSEGPSKPQQRETGATRTLLQYLVSDQAIAEAITAALVRQGLIWNDPPGFEEWGLTDYGRGTVGYLHDMQIGASDDLRPSDP